MSLIECVPNFSEGRDQSVIRQIAAAIENTDGVHLLHVDSSFDANRTVMTLVGSPAAVLEAAFRAIAVAHETIDMRRQVGNHPRIGATDVCPLVPLTGATIAECIELSNQLAARVAASLAIPVFLYAHSARRPERARLSFLRKGGYEGLEKRLSNPDFEPDFGPHSFNAMSGATVIGARHLLVAFNVNLESADVHLAKAIARELRQRRDGKTMPEPYPLADCRALGWFMPTYQRAQVSTNLYDYKKTGMFEMFMSIKELAKVRGLATAGSELIGMVPRAALLDVACKIPGDAGAALAAEEDLLDAAVAFLGLDAVRSFVWREQILECQLERVGLQAALEPKLDC